MNNDVPIEDNISNIMFWTVRETRLANECRRLREQLKIAMGFVPSDWIWNDVDGKLE